MQFAVLASFRPQRQPTRFICEICVIFFCQALGAPISLLRAHAVAHTQFACQIFVLDQYGDHVLTCKKHPGAIAGHDHVINVSAQRARNSGLRVCVNRKVATTAADSNKQGDVQAIQFCIPGYVDLVCDVSLVCDRIGSSTQRGLNGNLQLCDHLHARARSKISKFRRDYAAKNIALVPAILSVAGRIHPEFLGLMWVMADIQTVKYFNLVGDEGDIGSEHLKWSRVSKFSYDRNMIGLAVAYALAVRTHLSVHGTAHPMIAASVRPRAAADYLIRSAVDISHPRQQGTTRAGMSVASGLVRSHIINGLGADEDGGVAILCCLLEWLLESFPQLLLLLLFHCRRVAASSCRHKVKNCITEPLQVPRLVVLLL